MAVNCIGGGGGRTQLSQHVVYLAGASTVFPIPLAAVGYAGVLTGQDLRQTHLHLHAAGKGENRAM